MQNPDFHTPVTIHTPHTPNRDAQKDIKQQHWQDLRMIPIRNDKSLVQPPASNRASCKVQCGCSGPHPVRPWTPPRITTAPPLSNLFHWLTVLMRMFLHMYSPNLLFLLPALSHPLDRLLPQGQLSSRWAPQQYRGAVGRSAPSDLPRLSRPCLLQNEQSTPYLGDSLLTSPWIIYASPVVHCPELGTLF